MAVTSSSILNDGKANTTKLLTAVAEAFGYNGIGVGNDTNPAAESDHGILGNESNYKPGNASFFTNGNSSFIAQWNSSWVYGDLPTHIFREVVVCRGNESFASGECLLRAVYDAVTLGSGDSLAITAQVACTEG